MILISDTKSAWDWWIVEHVYSFQEAFYVQTHYFNYK